MVFGSRAFDQMIAGRWHVDNWMGVQGVKSWAPWTQMRGNHEGIEGFGRGLGRLLPPKNTDREKMSIVSKNECYVLISYAHNAQREKKAIVYFVLHMCKGWVGDTHFHSLYSHSRVLTWRWC